MKCHHSWLHWCYMLILLVWPVLTSANSPTPPLMRVGTMLHIQSDHPAVLLLNKAYAELGFKMQLELLPAERALRESKRGELLDATLVASRAIEQSNLGLLRVPVMIYQLEFSVFSSDPKLKFSDWRQLQPYNVVMINGMVAVKHFLEQTPGQKIEAVLSIEQALRQLELGRNQLAVLPKFEAEAMLNKLQLKKVSVLSPPLAVEPAYHYVHPKHQLLVEPLTRVLSRLTGQPVEVVQQPVATSVVLMQRSRAAGLMQAVKNNQLVTHGIGQHSEDIYVQYH
jgi:polar amino acid transport system substrate-binding protein